jgi:hypothetical protein
MKLIDMIIVLFMPNPVKMDYIHICKNMEDLRKGSERKG